jgi:alkyldihydroxyacetonephosphate synthase
MQCSEVLFVYNKKHPCSIANYIFHFSCIATTGRVEHAARDEIMRLGGSLSHHHGIGKLRKGWMEKTVSKPGMELLKGIKQTIDPTNVFASGNLV